MTPIAGQPEYVGVISTTTVPSPSVRTSRSTPRSARVSTGSSGSTTDSATRRGLTVGARPVVLAVTTSPPDAGGPGPGEPRAGRRPRVRGDPRVRGVPTRPATVARPAWPG